MGGFKGTVHKVIKAKHKIHGTVAVTLGAMILLSTGSSAAVAATSVGGVSTDVLASAVTLSPFGDGAVAGWSFDETSGSMVNDASTYGNNGVLVDNPVRTDGVSGNALDFDGVNDFVNCGNDASLGITGALTLSAWVRPDDLGKTMGIISKGIGFAGDGNYGYALSYWAPNQRIYFDTYSSSARDSLNSSQAILTQPGEWYHIAATWDGTRNANGKKLYINGELLTQKTSSIAAMGNPGYDLIIGRRGPIDAFYFDGKIDEVGVWGKAMSATEIQSLYRLESANSAPVLGAVGGKAVSEGSLLEFAVSATDADGDALMFSASNLPAGASFDPSSRMFSWMPSYSQAGTYNDVSFEVSDGSLADSESIAITVANSNQSPILTDIGGKAVTEGSLLQFTVSATDADSDGLTFSASNLPTGASFDPSSRVFSWTPAYSQAGTYNDVSFEVSDGSLTDSESIAITVADHNRAPVMANVGDKGASEGSLLQFTVSATDADGDNLTFSASNLPAGASFDPSSQKFSWTPAYSQAGTYSNVGFEVSDGSLTDSEGITVTVNPVEAPPVLAPVARIQGIVGHWNFDENSGSVANDASPYGNNGTVVSNSPEWVGGSIGSALNFNGADDYVRVANSASLSFTGPLTIEAWVNPAVAGEGVTNSGVLAKGDAASGWSWQLRYNAPDGKMGFQFNADPAGSTWVSIGENLNPGQWYHIAGVFDGANAIAYLNGVEKSRSTMTAVRSSDAPVVIGQDGWNNHFNGRIDEVKVYNKALSAQEIKEAANAASNNTPTPTPTPTPVPDPEPSPTGWANSTRLTVNRDRVDANLTDFPVLVHLSAASGINRADVSAVFTHLGSDANRKKISVTDAQDNELYVEIEKWDTASKQAWLWVKVPTISADADTDIYLHYDKNHADNDAYVGDIGSTPAQNVWNSGYKAVYHLGDTGTTVVDSTRYAHHGTKMGNGGPTPVAGIVGDSAYFDGSTYVSIPDSDDFSIGTSGHLIVNTWFSPSALTMSSSRSDGQIRFFSKSANDNHEWCLNYYNEGTKRDQGIAFYVFNLDGGLGTGHYMWPYGDPRNEIGIGEWEQLSGRSDEASAVINGVTRSHWVSTYKNGEYRNGQDLDNTAVINPSNGSAPVTLGHSLSFDSWLNGRMDEVRIDSAPRSDAWMKVDHDSQFDNLITFSTT